MFVTTPTRKWLAAEIKRCSTRLIVASPFVGESFVSETAVLGKKADVTLVTRTDLRVFAGMASNLKSLITFASRGGHVFGLPGLHAKAYVIDDRIGLVTSANATFSGMNRNWECGVVIDDPLEIKTLTSLILGGFGSPLKPSKWTASDLEMLKSPVSALQSAMGEGVSTVPETLERETPIRLPRTQWGGIAAAMPGWTRLTFEAVLSQPSDEFDLSDIYSTGLAAARKRFPKNAFPRQKLRQQMQRLRDLGLIEFLGEGRYRRQCVELPAGKKQSGS